MFGTNRMVGFAFHLTLKPFRRIGTTKVKEMGPGKLIPKLLQKNGGITFFLFPKNRNHFSENDDAPVLYVSGCLCSANDGPKFPKKFLTVWTTWLHKLGQGFGRIGQHKTAAFDGLIQLNPLR